MRIRGVFTARKTKMLVKEQDAKRFFCPVVSAAQQHIVCKGSHCMAWRWTTYPADPQRHDEESTLDQFGYCGLAGVIALPPV
jgi:hypothetical protein